jgi:hypothetical protein
MTFLDRTIDGYKERMKSTMILSIAPAIIWHAVLFRTGIVQPQESPILFILTGLLTLLLLPFMLVLRLLAGLLTPLILAITPVTLVLGIAAAVLQTMAFPFECMVSKIRDMIQSTPPAWSGPEGVSVGAMPHDSAPLQPPDACYGRIFAEEQSTSASNMNTFPPYYHL